MDRASVEVSSPAPQTITIGLDPVLRALLADTNLMLGNLLNEMREMRRITAEMKAGNDIVIASQIEANQARMEADRMSIRILGSLEAQDAAVTQNEAATSDELARHGVQTDSTNGDVVEPEIVRKSPQEILDEVYAGIEDTWFVGKDNKYYVHGENGDRRVTAQELRAIESQTARSRSRKRR